MSSLHGVRKGCCFSPDALGDNSVWTPASVILGFVSKERHVASRSIGADCKTNVKTNRCIHNAELGSMRYIPPKMSLKIPKVAVRYMYLVEESLVIYVRKIYVRNSLCFTVEKGLADSSINFLGPGERFFLNFLPPGIQPKKFVYVVFSSEFSVSSLGVSVQNFYTSLSARHNFLQICRCTGEKCLNLSTALQIANRTIPASIAGLESFF